MTCNVEYNDSYNLLYLYHVPSFHFVEHDERNVPWHEDASHAT